MDIETFLTLLFFSIPFLAVGVWLFLEIKTEKVYARVLAGIVSIVVVTYYVSGYHSKRQYAQILHYKNLAEKNKVSNDLNEGESESVQ